MTRHGGDLCLPRLAKMSGSVLSPCLGPCLCADLAIPNGSFLIFLSDDSRCMDQMDGQCMHGRYPPPRRRTRLSPFPCFFLAVSLTFLVTTESDSAATFRPSLFGTSLSARAESSWELIRQLRLARYSMGFWRWRRNLHAEKNVMESSNGAKRK